MRVLSVDSRTTTVTIEHCTDDDSVTVYTLALEWDDYPDRPAGWSLLDIRPNPPTEELRDRLHSEAIEELQKEQEAALQDERDYRGWY